MIQQGEDEPTDQNHFRVSRSRGFFIAGRHDDDPLVSAMLSMIFDENHPAMKDEDVALPALSFFEPFGLLSSQDQAQVLYRAFRAANVFMRIKRIIKPSDPAVPLRYISRANLALMFGKCYHNTFSVLF